MTEMPRDRSSGKSVRSLGMAGALIVAYVGLLSLLGSYVPAPRLPRRLSVPLPTRELTGTCGVASKPHTGSPVLDPPLRDIFQWATVHLAGPSSPEPPRSSDRPPVVRLPDDLSAPTWVLLGVLQGEAAPLSVWQVGPDVQTLRAGDRLTDGVRIHEVRPDGVVLALPGGRSRYLRVGERLRP